MMCSEQKQSRDSEEESIVNSTEQRNSTSKVSICIPTYEMHGFGVQFLSFNINKIIEQTYKNIEVVISDHSSNNDVRNCLNKYNDDLEIKYYKNEEKKGCSSANINNAISKATGDYIKIIFQDDFLFHKDSILDIISAFELEKKKQWLVTSSQHTKDGLSFDREFHPSYQDNIHLGNNTISSPSVLAFRNQDIIFFDEHLVWLMDVDYYKRLYLKFGEPIFLMSVNVVNRIWEKQYSNIVSRYVKYKELRYVKRKFKALRDNSAAN